MSPARILIIRSTGSYGGAERQIVGYAKRLDPDHYIPTVCTFSDDGGEDNPLLKVASSEGINTAVIQATKGFDSHGIKHLESLIIDLDIDLLCPQDYRANVYAVVAGRRLGVPVAATAHGYTGHTLNVRFYESCDRLLVLRAADGVVCVSNALRKRLRHWGVPGRKLHLVYNSIDSDGIDSPLSAEPAAQLDLLGAKRVCSVGRLSVEKGHRFLIQAWPDVLERHPDASLVLVGDGPERDKLEHQARALGIAARVEFAGFTDRPMDYIKASTLFVLPSLIEGLPVALLEACAAGRSVVASQVGGIGEVITHGMNGILIKAGRPGAIAENVSMLLANPQMMGSYGSNARKTVEEKFSFEKNLPRLEQFYRYILDAGRESAAGSGRPIVDEGSDLCRE